MKSNLRLVKNIPLPEFAEIYYAKIASLTNEESGEPEYKIQLADESELLALKAESCFILPEVGDQVLVAGVGSEQKVFIVHILTRAGRNAKTIDFGESASLKAENLSLEACSQVTIEAPEINLSGIKGSAKFDQSYLLSNWCEVRAKKALLMAESIERIANTVTEKIVNLFKNIEGIEFTKANRIRTLVTGRFFCKAKHLTINAEEEVAIDGKKINMG